MLKQQKFKQSHFSHVDGILTERNSVQSVVLSEVQVSQNKRKRLRSLLFYEHDPWPKIPLI